MALDTLEELRFAVGDLVVYASHGIGRVADRNNATVVLEFEERGLSVTLPIERAAECVRAVSTENEIADIGRTLGEAARRYAHHAVGDGVGGKSKGTFNISRNVECPLSALRETLNVPFLLCLSALRSARSVGTSREIITPKRRRSPLRWWRTAGP